MRRKVGSDLSRSYQGKRDRFCGALDKAGLSLSISDGAYYLLANVSTLPGSTGKARALYLLDKTGVAGVHGEALFSGPAGAGFIRFSYAKTDEDLDRACQKIQQLHR